MKKYSKEYYATGLSACVFAGQIMRLRTDNTFQEALPPCAFRCRPLVLRRAFGMVPWAFDRLERKISNSI